MKRTMKSFNIIAYEQRAYERQHRNKEPPKTRTLNAKGKESKSSENGITMQEQESNAKVPSQL